MNVYIDMLIVGLAIFFYLAIARGMSRAIQPLRLYVVDSINELSDDPTVPTAVRDDLIALSGSMFSRYKAWRFVLLLPVAALASSIHGPNSNSKISLKRHPKRKEIVAAYLCGAICMLARSPIALFIFCVEMLLLVIVPQRIAKVTRNAVHSAVSDSSLQTST